MAVPVDHPPGFARATNLPVPRRIMSYARTFKFELSRDSSRRRRCFGSRGRFVTGALDAQDEEESVADDCVECGGDEKV